MLRHLDITNEKAQELQHNNPRRGGDSLERWIGVLEDTLKVENKILA